MGNILSVTNRAMTVNAIEQNLIAWLDVFKGLEGTFFDDSHGLKRTITDIPMALFNSIMNAQLEPEAVEPAIEYVLADARARNVPILWWVGPSSRPADLAASLLDHGFCVDEDGPGMAVELDRLIERVPASDGVSILPAEHDASWRAWCEAMAGGFEIPAYRAELAKEQWHFLLSKAQTDKIRAYTAWRLNRPVATSLLLLGGGVAGIYAVATIPEERRKGIGAQVTLHALNAARALGYKVGILQSSEMGYPVYRALGFREYCRITSYRWKPDKEQGSLHSIAQVDQD